MRMQLGLFSKGMLALGFLALFVSVAGAQSPRVLYTWNGSGDTRGWGFGFGNNTGLVFDNNIAGVLRFSEGAGHNGASYSVVDHPNRIDEAWAADVGGLDLYGLDAIEFDLGMNNTDSSAIDVAFYVQASPGFDFINIPNISIPDTNNALNTYSFPLSGLTDVQKAHIRFIGLEVRQHTGDASFRLGEVRSVGTPDDVRSIASHQPGTIENGFNGGRINFDFAAVAGSTGNNQTGLSVVNGAMTWTDLGGGPGAAISYQNGQWPWNGNDFESRPHDNSNYNYALFKVRATDLTGAVGQTLPVQGFTQTSGPARPPGQPAGTNYFYQTLGPDQPLAADGQWHVLAFPLSAIQNQLDRIYTNNISLNFQGHANDTKIEIDWVRYHTTIPEPASLALYGLALVCVVGRRQR